MGSLSAGCGRHAFPALGLIDGLSSPRLYTTRGTVDYLSIRRRVADNYRHLTIPNLISDLTCCCIRPSSVHSLQQQPWYPTTSTSTRKRLEAFHNATLRFLTGLPWYVSNTGILRMRVYNYVKDQTQRQNGLSGTTSRSEFTGTPEIAEIEGTIGHPALGNITTSLPDHHRPNDCPSQLIMLFI
ncbi:hypothetical protein J6590_017480 [Homalodisca vitripennis]|nr:hypothetical protein J6590_017480 [Homalodisca vitripennis]